MTESIEQLEKKRKSGPLAAGLNVLLPGIGYMYCGMYVIGILALPLVLMMYMADPMMAIPLWAILIIDGFLASGRYNKKIDEKIKAIMKTCPKCAEQVLPAAKVCKHCGNELPL